MKKVLVFGGSGHVSGAVVKKCLEYGFDVTTITRGTREKLFPVREWHADRQDEASLRQLLEIDHADEEFDAVLDCICYNAASMKLALDILKNRTGHWEFISTDWVYEPTLRRFPQPVDSPYLTDDKNGLEAYGYNKRQAELILFDNAPEHLNYNVFRPCHIYGMPSELGCYPGHCRDKELIRKILNDEPIALVESGRMLQQPIDVLDLAETMISCLDNPAACNRIFNMAGPDIVESREYYEIIARALNKKLTVKNINFDEYLAANPAHRPFLCHRVYRQDDLIAAQVKVPATTLVDGLTCHTLAKRQQLGL